MDAISLEEILSPSGEIFILYGDSKSFKHYIMHPRKATHIFLWKFSLTISSRGGKDPSMKVQHIISSRGDKDPSVKFHHIISSSGENDSIRIRLVLYLHTFKF